MAAQGLTAQMPQGTYAALISPYGWEQCPCCKGGSSSPSPFHAKTPFRSFPCWPPHCCCGCRRNRPETITSFYANYCGNWFSFNADEEPQAESWCSLLLMLILTPSPAFKTRISCPAAGQERVIWIYFLVKSAAVCLDNHNSSTVIIKLNFMWYAGNFMAVLINITLVGTYIK